jgi:hypothetical protein
MEMNDSRNLQKTNRPNVDDVATSAETASSKSDVLNLRELLTTTLQAKRPESKHYVVEVLGQLGTLLTSATVIGIIAKPLGLSDAETATVSIFAISALYIVIYREAIQKYIRSYILLIMISAAALSIYLYKERLIGLIVDRTLGAAAGIVDFAPRANDFLPKLEKYITGAKQEIWFTGISFYVSLPQYKDIIIKKLAEGINVRFLVYDPNSQNLKDVARGFSQTDKSLKSECDLTIQNLKEIHDDWKIKDLPGRFEVRVFTSIPKARIYIFDRTSEDGYTFFIPHVDQQNSPILPGFLVKNIKTGIAPAYFEGIERLWKNSKPILN